MTTLLTIGSVRIDDADFAVQGFPAISYGSANKEYALANGGYTTKRVARKAPTMTIVLVHAPGQEFAGQLRWFAQFVRAPGESWWDKLEPIVALQELEEAQDVSVGDLDFGRWFVEQVDVRGDKTTITGGSRGGFTSATFDVTIRLKAQQDERTANFPGYTPPTEISPEV